MYKILAKSNYLRLSYRRFSTFSHAILGMCRTDRAFWGVLRFNFTKLGRGSNDVKFHIFDPPVKIGGGVGEIYLRNVEALPTTEPPKYIWWPSTARLLSTVDW